MKDHDQERVFEFLKNNMDPTKATPMAIATELDIPIDIVIVYMTMWYEIRGVHIE